MENQIEIKLGITFVAECLDLNHEGQGVCKINGIFDKQEVYNYPVFVNEMLIGEKAQLKFIKLSKNYGYAEIVKLYNDKKSLSRVRPLCPNYGQCGGCNIMHMNYDAQLEFKTKMVKDTLRKIGNIENVTVSDTIGMKNHFNYRNKVQVPFRKLNEKTICGFFRRDSHRVIPLTTCLIQPDISTSIVNFVKNLSNEFKIDGYDEKTNQGLLRHVLVRTNNDLSQIMLILVLTDKVLKEQNNIINKIINRYPNIKSIYINVNKTIGNTILGEKFYLIYGKKVIEDTLCDLKFKIGPNSFYQVNHHQTQVLYSKAIEIANLNQNDILIDAYCGIGTIGLIASKKVSKVYSVEIIPEAIKNAIENAKINKIENVSFVCNKSEEQIIKWQNEGINATSIVVDPPRKGCDIKLLETIVQMKIPKIIYISCDPATLSRDLKILVSKGYKILHIQPIDMFPNTSNVETIVLLSYKSNNI